MFGRAAVWNAFSLLYSLSIAHAFPSLTTFLKLTNEKECMGVCISVRIYACMVYVCVPQEAYVCTWAPGSPSIYRYIYVWIHTWGPEGLKWAIKDLCIRVCHTWAKMYVCRRVEDKCSSRICVHVCNDKCMIFFCCVLLDESLLVSTDTRALCHKGVQIHAAGCC